MKILITGFNKAQCTRKFYLNQQLKVVPSQYSLFNCLHDMGHEVEQRVVKIGEDLAEYDEVFVFIAGPRQLVTTQLFNGLWAISQRPDCIIAVDDWQAPDLLKGVEKCLDPKELLCDFILGVNKTTIEEVTPHLDAYTSALKVVAAKKNRTLISAFDTTFLNDDSFGPHLLFENVVYPKDRMFVYNPNPYHRNRKPSDIGHEGAEDPFWGGDSLDSFFDSPVEKITKKERKFNFASLVQSRTKKWLKNQGVDTKNLDTEQATIGDWTVDLYGSKADSQKRLTEDQMCQVFANDWGCLMPGYFHAGSGWWRARPTQCADAGSILIGDPKEMTVYYGKDFKWLNLKAKDVIDMTDEQLAQIASDQKQALYTNHPLDKKVQQRELNDILKAPK